MNSSRHSAESSTRSVWPWLVVGLFVLLLIGALAAWSLTRPLTITVDGEGRMVPARATVLDLQDDHLLKSERGALLSLQGNVLQRRGGAEGTVTRNGRPVSVDQPLFEGDVIVSRKGADLVEGKVVRRESVPIAKIEEGAGSVVVLKRLGSPSIVEVTIGKKSGVEATRSVVTTGDPMVVVRRPPTSADRLVALTFDDGPWPGQTDKILDILKQQNVRATFFMLGSQVRRSPELTRRVAAEGHAVGSHSLSHKQLTKLKPAAIRKEISGGVSAVSAATGVRPAWFRPPYGAVNGAVKKQARILKVRMAMWDIDTLDWTRPGAHELYRNAVRSTKPGQVVLMHDGGNDRRQTIEALPLIIEDLRAKGYTFVTMDELAAAK